MPSSKEGKAKQKRDIHIWNCPENIHVCTPAEWTVQMNWEPVSALLMVFLFYKQNLQTRQQVHVNDKNMLTVTDEIIIYLN